MILKKVLSKFLLTPLREGRLEALRDKVAERIFLLTPLREGRPSHGCTRARCELFLLTPLREGRPSAENYADVPRAISTHAPAGGATQLGPQFWITEQKFLLTPLREGRRYSQENHFFLEDFYSRPCGRGDLAVIAALIALIIISTHAPAGGATEALDFIPRKNVKFLLTPLREGRPVLPAVAGVQFYFYSRPCGRGDQKKRLR